MGGLTWAIGSEANQLQNDCNHTFSLNISARMFLSKVVSINGIDRPGGRTAVKSLCKLKLRDPYLFDSHCVLEDV